MSYSSYLYASSQTKTRWHFFFFVFIFPEIVCLTPQCTIERSDYIMNDLPSKLLIGSDNKRNFLQKTNAKKQICKAMYNIICPKESFAINNSEYPSDTLTNDDLVKNHYLSLPYPAVSNESKLLPPSLTHEKFVANVQEL